MGLTRNLNRIGMAAHNERREIADYIFSCQSAELKRKAEQKREIIKTCAMIRDLVTQKDYDAWWESTPDDDEGFLAAAHAKLKELQDRKLDSLSLECQRISNWLTDHWDEIPEIPF